MPTHTLKVDAESDSRIRLYDFTTGQQTFYQWLAGLLPNLNGKSILELGAGNGHLWQALLPRCQGTDLYLTDINEGFLNQAEFQLKDRVPADCRVEYGVLDMNQLDIGDRQFDVVIANHNLFYAKDIDQLIKQISGLLVPGGMLVCSTVGDKHLIELVSLLRQIDSDLAWSSEHWASVFGLGNGYRKLINVFDRVDQFEYDNTLHVTSIEPILDYLHKTMKGALSTWVDHHEAALRTALQECITQSGKIRLTPASGFFIAYQ